MELCQGLLFGITGRKESASIKNAEFEVLSAFQTRVWMKAADFRLCALVALLAAASPRGWGMRLEGTV